jgi:hypothetical protein
MYIQLIYNIYVYTSIYLDVASLRAGSCYFGNSQASCYPVIEAHPHLQLKAADDTAWVWGLVFFGC